jgi:two-component system, OmpR family, sensor histidine kinase MprB
MTLRLRIALIAALAVAAAVIAASLSLYLTTQNTLYGTVDQALLDIVQLEPPPGGQPPSPGARTGSFGGAGGFIQAVTLEGDVLRPAGAITTELLPVTEAARNVAAGVQGRTFETVQVDAMPIRTLIVPLQPGVALQVARPLGEVEDVLEGLRRRLAIGSVLGVLLAAALGTLVASRAMRPVRELTDLAEEVGRTQDLSRRIALARNDEVGRLARAFDRMLEELEEARRSQERLVTDASHELRTPLTSLRTNIEVLAELDRLEPDDRRELLRDVELQLGEFASLIASLTELARGEQPSLQRDPVRLDACVRRAVALAPRADAQLRLDTEPVTIVGDADRIERAIAELLENARKYAPGADVEVAVTADGTVRVRDHGPGIAAEERDHVLERFHRATSSRGTPGSGLGLSIVRQIVTAHGGSIEVVPPAETGACIVLRFPPVDPRDGAP